MARRVAVIALGASAILAASCQARSGGRAFMGGQPPEPADPAKASAAADAYVAAQEALYACAGKAASPELRSDRLEKARAKISGLDLALFGKGPLFRAEVGRIARERSGEPYPGLAAELAAAYGADPEFAKAYDNFIDITGGKTK